MNLKFLDTERINNKSKNIDKLETLEILKLINSEDKTVAKAVENELNNIKVAVDSIYDSISEGGRLIYIGAGTSGRLGVLDASECTPTFGVDSSLVVGLIAGGKEAMFKAKEGAEDSEALAINDLNNINLTKKDSVVGLAASGRTPYVIGGLRYAKKLGATTVSICCVKEGLISKESDIAIEAIVGPEVLTGSTRMKSGTAQKMILNMISTSVMIKLGKVYGNLMVDVKATNDKLYDRANRIIEEVTGATREKSERILRLTNNDVKLSIFMILSNLDLEEAKEKLLESNGHISVALEKLH